MTEPEASQSWTTDEEDFESASEGGNDDQRGQDDDMGENEEDVADVRDVLTAARAVPAATIATALAGARAETKGVANTSVKADEDAHARARDVRDARRTDKNVEELAHERGTGVESAATSAAPAPASAWSWGGFLTSAVSAVAESLTADVDSLVGTAKNVGEGLKKATVESVDRVYGTLDPAFASGNGEVRSPMAVSTAIAEEPDVAATAVSTEQHSPRFVNPLAAIDRTFDFASDLLGNAVLGGYRTLENAKIGEKLGELQHKVEQSDVVAQSREAGGSLLTHGLTALESVGSIVGKKAAQALADARKQSGASTVDSRGILKATRREAGFVDYFEDNCGNAHLQALEMLATECTIKLKTFGPNALTDPIISKIEDCFDMDGVLDDLGDVEESRLLTEDGYSDSIRLLGDIGMTNTRQLSAFKEFLFGTRKALESGDAEFEKKLKDLVMLAGSPQDQTSVLEISATTELKELRATSMKALADCTEKACEQILRIAEVLLMAIAELKAQREEGGVDTVSATAGGNTVTLKMAQNLQTLTTCLLTELLFVHTLLAEAGRCRLTAVRVQASAVNGLDEVGLTNLFGRIDEKLKDFTRQLESDLNRAVAYVQDAMGSNIAILKMMHMYRQPLVKSATTSATPSPSVKVD